MSSHAADEGLAAEAPPGLAVRGRRFVLACAGGFFIWLLMVGTLDPAELLAGAVVAVLTALIAGPHLGLLDGVRLGAAMPWHMARFFWTFLVALLQSNLDMARRVLSPSLPIRPGIVEVGTELRSELGRLLLANAITLTPGTLSVDVIGDRLLVHWVDVPPGADRALATRSIAAGFERHLKGFLR